MNLFEELGINNEDLEDVEQHIFNVTQVTQVQLIEDANVDPEIWIAVNSERFRTLIQDPEFNLIERLANEETRAKAMEELKSKLYN